MPDSYGNPLPTDFSNAFTQDLNIGSIPTGNSTSDNLFNFLGNQPTQDTNLGGGDTSWFDGFFSNGKGGQGWGVPALGAAQGVAQSFLGFQQLSEGKKQNRIAQNQWQQQFDIQKGEYDRRTAERNARVAASNANRDKATLGG